MPQQEKNNEKIQELLKKIEEIDEKIKNITESIPLKLGSIVRIASQALKNWGIDIDAFPPYAITELERKSMEEYSKEWTVVNDSVYRAIHQAVADSNLGDGNQQLNTEIAKIAKDIIVKKIKDGKKMIMADIGAGTGETTATILRWVSHEEEKINLENIEVYFIEPSLKSTTHILEIMQRSYPTVKYQIIISTDYTHMPLLKNNVFDMVVSNAVFHHHSFPNYLSTINKTLKKDGFLLVGDWYSEIWYEPKTVAYLLKEGLGLSEERINSFINLFEKSTWPEIVQYWNNKNEEEKIRNEGMLLYTKNLLKRLNEENKHLEEERERAIREQKIASDINTKVELNLFEAHEKYEDRIEKIKKAGFEVNCEKIRQRHRWLEKTNIEREVATKNFAMVTLACKK